MSTPKEISYFCCDHIYAEGKEWYQRFFREAAHYRNIGEGSTNYSRCHLNPMTAERIVNDLPNVRILYITKHPMEQMVSHWRYTYALGEEYRKFSRAIRNDPAYLSTCDYAHQIAAFSERLPNDRILVLFLEDLKSDFEAFMGHAFGFLKVRTPDDFARVSLNRSDSLSAPSLLAKSIQHIPGIYRWGTFVPPSFREPIARALFRDRRVGTFLASRRKGKTGVARSVPKPSWDTELLEEILDGVEERAKLFLKESGKPTDFWDFRPYRAQMGH